VRFSGTDELLRSAGPDALAAALQATVSMAQEALDAEGVTLLAIDIDNDGGKLFLGSGVPTASEDDEGRMLRALRRIVDRGAPLPLQAGVHRGHVFAAEVGAPGALLFGHGRHHQRRRARRQPGPSTPTRRCSTTPALFEAQPAGPLPVQGKKIAQVVYRVGEKPAQGRGRGGRYCRSPVAPGWRPSAGRLQRAGGSR
jgi:hypothetical protein